MKTVANYYLSILFLLLVFSGCTSPVTSAMEVKVSFLVGDVLVNGQKPNIDAVLSNNSLIKTGTGSECEITFGSKNILHILENSSLTLNWDKITKSLKLDRGGVVGILKNLMKPADEAIAPFRVETSTAIAAVRGTALIVKVEDPTNTYICDCNGAVEMTAQGSRTFNKVIAAHHKAYRFSLNEKGPSQSEAGLLYHDDTAVEAIAKKINVEVDWNKADLSRIK